MSFPPSKVASRLQTTEESAPQRASNPFRESILRLLNTVPQPVEDPDDLETDPPPAIDPQRVADIPKLGSLDEGIGLFKAINRHIELQQGVGELQGRVQKLEYLKKANEAKRCAPVRLDGRQCGSPAIRDREYYFYHREIHADNYELPALEDHHGVQLAYMHLYRKVNAGMISLANAKILLQILQGAAKNLPESDFSEERITTGSPKNLSRHCGGPPWGPSGTWMGLEGTLQDFNNLNATPRRRLISVSSSERNLTG